jgi:hypothetical protein
MIKARTAFVLYAVIAGAALLILKGKPLWLALIIVGALVAKTYVDELRRRL